MKKSLSFAVVVFLVLSGIAWLCRVKPETLKQEPAVAQAMAQPMAVEETAVPEPVATEQATNQPPVETPASTTNAGPNKARLSFSITLEP